MNTKFEPVKTETLCHFVANTFFVMGVFLLCHVNLGTIAYLEWTENFKIS